MTVFELVISLLFVGAVLSGLARRLQAPYPALLALAGAALALFQNTPNVVLDPELALTLFVAPVLLNAGFDSSPRDLMRNWRAVTSLALVAVGLTIVGVAVVVRWMAPGLPWAAAVALGAIVAPSDAAAATAVLRQLQPPHRLLVILEGESLFNDASALLVYRLAVAAALTGSFSAWSALPLLAVVTVGSVVLGAIVSRVVLWVTSIISDIATLVIAQFLSTFAVWILAERLHLSGIITVVVFAILLARKVPDRVPARQRLPSYAVWKVVVFVLNVLAFILIGLQLKPILARLGAAELLEYLATAAAVCAAVIAIRVLWVAAYAGFGHWLRRDSSARLSSPREAVVIAWCGMRGIVTLAAALALPPAFPGRALILFTAFSVVLATLVFQGMTLSPLMRLLGLERDDSIDREVDRALIETARAALAVVDAPGRDPEVIALLRRRYQTRLRRAEAAVAYAAPPADDGAAEFTATLREVIAAERRALSALRATGVIGDDAFRRVEEELDLTEINAEAIQRRIER